MESAFSPDHRKIRCFGAYTYACIYVYLNVNRETFMATAHEFQFASTPPPPPTRPYTMKPAPATRLIPSSCAENVARTACESFSEFIITSIRIKSSIHDSVRSWKIVCRGYCRLLLQTTFGYTHSYAKQEVGRYRAATTQKFS